MSGEERPARAVEAVSSRADDRPVGMGERWRSDAVRDRSSVAREELNPGSVGKAPPVRGADEAVVVLADDPGRASRAAVGAVEKDGQHGGALGGVAALCV